MIIRITKKLASKIKIKLPEADNFNADAIEEWYSNLFTVSRIQYFLFTNAYSLYSVIVPAKGIAGPGEFINSIFSSLYLQLEKDNLEYLMNRFRTPSLETIDFIKTNSRGVLGSMNDMIFNAKYFISLQHLLLMEVSGRLNKNIYRYLKFESPLHMIKIPRPSGSPNPDLS